MNIGPKGATSKSTSMSSNGEVYGLGHKWCEVSANVMQLSVFSVVFVLFCQLTKNFSSNFEKERFKGTLVLVWRNRSNVLLWHNFRQIFTANTSHMKSVKLW